MNLRDMLDVNLYLVVDPEFVPNNGIEQLLEDCVSGGISVVQVRAKGYSNDDLLSLCSRALKVLRPLGIPLIVNDRVEVALAAGAQGVHIGQADVHWSHARQIMGDHAIVGLSVETMQQAFAAKNADVDYLGVSAIFPTKSKMDVQSHWGLGGLRSLRQSSNARLVGIGGITEQNARDVIGAGADGIAVISAICSSSNPKIAAQNLSLLVRESLRERGGCI